MNVPTLLSAALAVGLTAPLLIPAHSLAAPLPATPLPQKVTLVQTKHADVDGDGHRDTVRIYNAGKKGEQVVWKVKVTTASGKTSSLTFTSPGFGDEAPWYGWAKVDGHRGAELLLNGNTDDFFTVTVLTWRGGKLRIEKAPAFPGTTGHDPSWSAATENSPSGFRFANASGRRYVNVWYAECADYSTGTCTLKTKRSVWKNAAWRTVKTLPTTKISASAAHARSPFGALVIHK